jgi:hypothetical protein
MISKSLRKQESFWYEYSKSQVKNLQRSLLIKKSFVSKIPEKRSDSFCAKEVLHMISGRELGICDREKKRKQKGIEG